jgi:hypothetical protein
MVQRLAAKRRGERLDVVWNWAQVVSVEARVVV